MTTPLFQGAQGVRRRMAAAIAAGLPDYLTYLRAEWDLPGWMLSDPGLVLTTEPGKLGTDQREYPLIAVVGGRQTLRTAVPEDGELSVVSEYAMQVYAWVREAKREDLSGWQAAIEARDALGAAIAYWVMDRPHLDVQPLGTLLADPASVSLDPSEVDPVKGDRFVAGVRLNVTVRAEEALRRGAPIAGGPRGSFAAVAFTGAGVRRPSQPVPFDKPAVPEPAQFDGLGAVTPGAQGYLAQTSPLPAHPALD